MTYTTISDLANAIHTAGEFDMSVADVEEIIRDNREMFGRYEDITEDQFTTLFEIVFEQAS